MTEPADLPLGTRLWFAWSCFLRVLFDGAFAARAWSVREAMPALPAPGTGEEAEDRPAPKPPASMDPPPPPPPDRETRRRMANTVRETRPEIAEAASAAREAGGLLLLTLLQREGRLVDFLRQDVASFSDEDIGAAARVVHAGCGKALAEHATIEAVRAEEEGEKARVEEGYEPASLKLVGDVKGDPPFVGTLRHRGWVAKKLRLPEPVAGHDVRILAPAEVEL